MLRGCASVRWLSVSLVVGHVLAVGGWLLVAVGVRECYVCCERFLSKSATRERFATARWLNCPLSTLGVTVAPPNSAKDAHP